MKIINWKKLFFIAVFLFAFPVNSYATVPGIQFGGWIPPVPLTVVPCTCTPGVFLVRYVPMHPIGYPFVFHALLLTPATIKYNYLPFLAIPTPTTWHLGKFVPSPGVPCLQGIAPACAPSDFADGIIVETGSSGPRPLQ